MSNSVVIIRDLLSMVFTNKQKGDQNMAKKTLTTSYLVKLSNANHDGVTQQIDDRFSAFETDNMMLLQAAAEVRTTRQTEDVAFKRFSGKDFASDDLKKEDSLV